MNLKFTIEYIRRQFLSLSVCCQDVLSSTVYTLASMLGEDANRIEANLGATPDTSIDQPVGVIAVGGWFAPGSRYLKRIARGADLPPGSTIDAHSFLTGINLAPTPGLHGLEVTRLVNATEQVVERHGGQPAIFLTHSYGCRLGHDAINRRPDLVAGIVELGGPEKIPYFGYDGELPEGVHRRTINGLFDPIVPLLFASRGNRETRKVVFAAHIIGLVVGPGVGAAAKGIREIYDSRVHPVYQR